MRAYKTFCLSHWSIEDGYPLLELTFLRSTDGNVSKSLTIPLAISYEELMEKPLIKDLLMSAFELCDEMLVGSDDEKKTLEKAPFEQELEWCLAFSESFKQNYDKCCKEYGEEVHRKTSEIIKFIKSIKIFVRKTWAQFTEPALEMAELVHEEANVDSSLDFDPLCTLLSAGYKESSISIPLGKIPLNGRDYTIHVLMQRDDLSNAHIDPEFKRIFHRLQFALNTERPIFITLAYSEATPDEQKELTGGDFSRLSGFSSRQELKNSLRWAVSELTKKFKMTQESRLG
jgi:hypothetical protein